MAQTDLMQALGFDRDDLNANRKGKFSAAQLLQMRDFVRGALRPILRWMGLSTFALVILQAALVVAFGDTRPSRFIGTMLSAFWLIGMGYGGFIIFSLLRIRRGVRVGEATGTLTKRADEAGHLWLDVGGDAGGASFHFFAQSDRLDSALEDGATYTVYYMGPPHAATLLSMEKKR